MKQKKEAERVLHDLYYAIVAVILGFWLLLLALCHCLPEEEEVFT